MLFNTASPNETPSNGDFDPKLFVEPGDPNVDPSPTLAVRKKGTIQWPALNLRRMANSFDEIEDKEHVLAETILTSRFNLALRAMIKGCNKAYRGMYFPHLARSSPSWPQIIIGLSRVPHSRC
jgi:hypothetical protein